MIEGATGIICFIGLGANLGLPADQCLDAMERMHATAGVHVMRRSSLYRTEPVGTRDQGWFVNAVAEIRTVLRAGELLRALLSIEKAMGRQRDVPWGPRIIDLDILLYGQEVIAVPDMIIPHPAFHKRRFVLTPFNEIAPYVIHPAFGVSIHGLLGRLEDDHTVALMQGST
ncbi:MAG: 2-amino-4-hydroxy-6-hydroxymethyldihydropteridine diphosphokinase [Pseudomonadota bacterium]